VASQTLFPSFPYHIPFRLLFAFELSFFSSRAACPRWWSRVGLERGSEWDRPAAANLPKCE